MSRKQQTNQQNAYKLTADFNYFEREREKTKQKNFLHLRKQFAASLSKNPLMKFPHVETKDQLQHSFPVCDPGVLSERFHCVSCFISHSSTPLIETECVSIIHHSVGIRGLGSGLISCPIDLWSAQVPINKV